MKDLSFLETVWVHLTTRISSLVPTLLATALILIAGWVISRILASLVKRFLLRVKLDSWIEGNKLVDSIQPEGISPKPSNVISRVIFWLFFLCFIVIGVENLGLTLSDLPIRSFITYLPVVLGAVLLLVAGIVLATFLGRGTEAALRGMGIDHHRRFGQIVKGLIIALTAVLVVEQLGFDVTTLTRTFSNLVVVVAAGLVFSFAWGGREVARNVLASYYIREQFRQGDRVTVDGHEGVLEEVGSLSSRLARLDGGEVIVPNARLIEQTVAKRSPSPAER